MEFVPWRSLELSDDDEEEVLIQSGAAPDERFARGFSSYEYLQPEKKSRFLQCNSLNVENVSSCPLSPRLSFEPQTFRSSTPTDISKIEEHYAESEKVSTAIYEVKKPFKKVLYRAPEMHKHGLSHITIHVNDTARKHRRFGELRETKNTETCKKSSKITFNDNSSNNSKPQIYKQTFETQNIFMSKQVFQDKTSLCERIESVPKTSPIGSSRFKIKLPSFVNKDLMSSHDIHEGSLIRQEVSTQSTNQKAIIGSKEDGIVTELQKQMNFVHEMNTAVDRCSKTGRFEDHPHEKPNSSLDWKVPVYQNGRNFKKCVTVAKVYPFVNSLFSRTYDPLSIQTQKTDDHKSNLKTRHILRSTVFELAGNSVAGSSDLRESQVKFVKNPRNYQDHFNSATELSFSSNWITEVNGVNYHQETQVGCCFKRDLIKSKSFNHIYFEDDETISIQHQNELYESSVSEITKKTFFEKHNPPKNDSFYKQLHQIEQSNLFQEPFCEKNYENSELTFLGYNLLGTESEMNPWKESDHETNEADTSISSDPFPKTKSTNQNASKYPKAMSKSIQNNRSTVHSRSTRTSTGTFKNRNHCLPTLNEEAFSPTTVSNDGTIKGSDRILYSSDSDNGSAYLETSAVGNSCDKVSTSVRNLVSSNDHLDDQNIVENVSGSKKNLLMWHHVQDNSDELGIVTSDKNRENHSKNAQNVQKYGSNYSENRGSIRRKAMASNSISESDFEASTASSADRVSFQLSDKKPLIPSSVSKETDPSALRKIDSCNVMSQGSGLACQNVKPLDSIIDGEYVYSRDLSVVGGESGSKRRMVQSKTEPNFSNIPQVSQSLLSSKELAISDEFLNERTAKIAPSIKSKKTMPSVNSAFNSVYTGKVMAQDSITDGNYVAPGSRRNSKTSGSHLSVTQNPSNVAMFGEKDFQSFGQSNVPSVDSALNSAHTGKIMAQNSINDGFYVASDFRRYFKNSGSPGSSTLNSSNVAILGGKNFKSQNFVPSVGSAFSRANLGKAMAHNSIVDGVHVIPPLYAKTDDAQALGSGVHQKWPSWVVSICKLKMKNKEKRWLLLMARRFRTIPKIPMEFSTFQNIVSRPKLSQTSSPNTAYCLMTKRPLKDGERIFHTPTTLLEGENPTPFLHFPEI